MAYFYKLPFCSKAWNHKNCRKWVDLEVWQPERNKVHVLSHIQIIIYPPHTHTQIHVHTHKGIIYWTWNKKINGYKYKFTYIVYLVLFSKWSLKTTPFQWQIDFYNFFLYMCEYFVTPPPCWFKSCTRAIKSNVKARMREELQGVSTDG